LTKKEIEIFCSKKEGTAILFSMPDGSTFSFKHYDFLQHPSFYQFWKQQSTTRLGIIKHMLLKSTVERASALCACCLQEAHGDDMLSSNIALTFNQIIAVQKVKQSNQCKTMSYDQISENIHLDHKDVKFQCFRDCADEKVKNAITASCGRFSIFVEPILSPTLLHDLETKFIETLPIQCNVMMIQLNKFKGSDEETKDKLMPLWIRYSLFLFCQIMRIRNKNYFTCLSLCNAGGSYGQGRSHLGIHFGF